MVTRVAALRRKLATGQYELTQHAKEEMEQDGFVLDDVRQAIYTGRIVRTQRDRRGRKYTVTGRAPDGRGVRVICRLTSLGRLRIILCMSDRTMKRCDSCEYCGGKVRERKVTVDVRRKDELFVFDNVPVGVCSKCGERYYPGPVLERLNEIAAHREVVTATIKVPRLDFAEVAS